jgi:NADH dehydrogenase FAD-containing subunit
MGSIATKKSVVIVGGGHAGTSLARTLSSRLEPSLYDLLLIDSRPFSVWLPATIRIATSSKHDLEGKAFMPFDKLFVKNGTVLQGTVTAIRKGPKGSGGTLILENKDEIRYDILVLATGSIWEGPAAIPNTEADIKNHLEQSRSQFAGAKDVVLVGGGAVGIGE